MLFGRVVLNIVTSMRNIARNFCTILLAVSKMDDSCPNKIIFLLNSFDNLVSIRQILPGIRCTPDKTKWMVYNSIDPARSLVQVSWTSGYF